MDECKSLPEKSSSLASVTTTATTSGIASSTSSVRFKLCKKKVFLENLEWNVHENLLKNFLKKYSSIKRIKVIRDANTNKSKGYGYVEFGDEKDAEALVASSSFNTNTLVLNTRPIRASFYKEKVRFKNTNTNGFALCNKQGDKSAQMDMERDIQNNEINIVNALPYNVLVKIFSYLCLRDKCVVEQGSYLF